MDKATKYFEKLSNLSKHYAHTYDKIVLHIS